MLIVESVKVTEVHEDTPVHQIYHLSHALEIRPEDMVSNNENLIARIEEVRTEAFYNTSGEKVFIGWSEEVQTALGLPFEVFNSGDYDSAALSIFVRDITNEYNKLNAKLSEKIDQLRKKTAILQDEITMYKKQLHIRSLQF